MKTEKIKWILDYCENSGFGVDNANYDFVMAYADKWKNKNRHTTESEISRYLYYMYKIGLLNRMKFKTGARSSGHDRSVIYHYTLKSSNGI